MAIVERWLKARAKSVSSEASVSKDSCGCVDEIVRSVSQIRFGKQSKLPRECQIKIDGSTTPCDTMFIAVDRWIHRRLGQVRQRCETVASSSMTRTRKIYTVGKTTAVGVGPTTDWQPRSREFAHGDGARWLAL